MAGIPVQAAAGGCVDATCQRSPRLLGTINAECIVNRWPPWSVVIHESRFKLKES
jgi:hypothetical protein